MPGAQKKRRYFVAMFDYDPSTMSPNPDGCDEELPFQEGDTIKVSPLIPEISQSTQNHQDTFQPKQRPQRATNHPMVSPIRSDWIRSDAIRSAKPNRRCKLDALATNDELAALACCAN